MYTIYISLSRKDIEHTKKCNTQLITSTNPKSKIFSDILQIYYDEKFQRGWTLQFSYSLNLDDQNLKKISFINLFMPHSIYKFLDIMMLSV